MVTIEKKKNTRHYVLAITKCTRVCHLEGVLYTTVPPVIVLMKAH